MARDIVNKEALSLTEVKASLDKIKKRDEEMGFRSAKTHEYVKSFKLFSQKDFKEIYGKLVALEIPRIKDFHLKKIIDLMPVSVDDLKMILSGYVLTVNQDNMKKILDTLKEYRD